MHYCYYFLLVQIFEKVIAYRIKIDEEEIMLEVNFIFRICLDNMII